MGDAAAPCGVDILPRKNHLLLLSGCVLREDARPLLHQELFLLCCAEGWWSSRQTGSALPQREADCNEALTSQAVVMLERQAGITSRPCPELSRRMEPPFKGLRDHLTTQGYLEV